MLVHFDNKNNHDTVIMKYLGSHQTFNIYGPIWTPDGTYEYRHLKNGFRKYEKHIREQSNER